MKQYVVKQSMIPSPILGYLSIGRPEEGKLNSHNYFDYNCIVHGYDHTSNLKELEIIHHQGI
jgi:hypothetical protein